MRLETRDSKPRGTKSKHGYHFNQIQVADVVSSTIDKNEIGKSSH